MGKIKTRIIWSVDAFETSSETKAHVISLLTEMSKKQQLQIEPVYVLSPVQLGLMLEFSQPWIEYYKPATQKALASSLADVKIPGLMKPKVLIERKPSLTNAVKSLTRYAKQTDAELIAVGTHSRKGLSRLLMGSFAETALLYSKIPVLVVGPSAPSMKISHILFATDFGTKSSAVYRRVLDLAKRWETKLTIYHSAPHPIESVFQSGVYLMGGGWIPVPEYVSRQGELNQRHADKWVAMARKHGIHANSACEFGSGNVSQAILKHTELEQADLIAMAAESGPVASTLIGSITRQVIRNAVCPVWVLRP